MASLRRRFLGSSSSSTESSRAPSPAKTGEPTTLVATTTLEKLKSKQGKKSKKAQWALFGLGGVFGIVVAAFFAQRHDVINLEGLVDFNLESLIDVVPAGVIRDAKDITVGSQSSYRGWQYLIRRRDQDGAHMKTRDLLGYGLMQPRLLFSSATNVKQ